LPGSVLYCLPDMRVLSPSSPAKCCSHQRGQRVGLRNGAQAAEFLANPPMMRRPRVCWILSPQSLPSVEELKGDSRPVEAGQAGPTALKIGVVFVSRSRSAPISAVAKVLPSGAKARALTFRLIPLHQHGVCRRGRVQTRQCFAACPWQDRPHRMQRNPDRPGVVGKRIVPSSRQCFLGERIRRPRGGGSAA